MLKHQYIKALYIGLFFCFLFSKANAAVELVYPKDSATVVTSSVVLQWNNDPINNSFKVQVAYDAVFTNVIVSANITATSYTFGIPFPDTTYYWRVFDLTTNDYSSVFTFRYSSPTAIGSIAAWYKADVGVTQSGGLVSSWADQSGNGHTFMQATSTSQPTFIPSNSRINFAPSVRFNGTPALPNYMTTTPSIDVPGVFSVFTFRSLVENNATLEYLFAGSDNGIIANSGALGMSAGALGTNGGLNGATYNPFYGEFALYNNSSDTIWRNLAPLLRAYDGHVTGLSVTVMGARQGFLDFCYKGDMSELIMFSRNVSFREHASIFNYFRGKYEPPLNLGRDTVAGNGFCDTFRINAGARFMRYLWSTGDTTPSIKAITNGTYSVTVTDLFGIVSKDDITVLPYKRLGNRTVYLCKGDTLKLDLKLPGTYTATWSPALVGGTKVNITQNGTYIVTLSGPGACTYKDTINVVINEVSYSPPIANKNLTICELEKLFLISNIPIDSIAWSTGSHLPFTTFSTDGPYTVFSKTTTGCITKDTFNIRIAGKAPVANFGYETVCQNAPVNFTDSSIAPPGNFIQSWKWNFSTGHAANTQNSVDTFPLGIASASLKVTTNAGCSDSIFKTFVVNRNPKAGFTTLLSCSGIATTFVDQSIPNTSGLSDWLWDFAGFGTSHGVENPRFSFPAPGTYNVKLTAVNSLGCSDTITAPVTVNESPIANFSFDSVCGKSPVSFKFLGSATLPNVISVSNWDFGDGTFESSIRNPQHVYPSSGTYTVKLLVRSAPGQCEDTAIKQVHVFDYPVVDFSVSQTQCIGKEIQFTDISTTPDSSRITRWNWFFSGQGSSNEQNPRFTFNSPGNYTIQLTAYNAVGCSETKLRSIAVSSPPEPKFTFSPQNGLPPLTVTYFNQSSPSGNYIWDYGDGSPVDTAFTPPTHTYTVKGTYPIKLIGTDFRGCTDTLVKYILVDKAYLDGVMATVNISPNGDYYEVRVTIVNSSNVELTAMGLSIQLEGGAVIREDWTGSLLPGKSLDYIFVGHVKITDSDVPVICANIDYVNNHDVEDRTDNNRACKEIRVGGYDVLTVYPNPAYENINFGVMLPQDGRVTVNFIDYLGQRMYTQDFDGVKGYNNFSASTLLLNAAMYIAEISYDGQVIRKKIMREDRK